MTLTKTEEIKMETDAVGHVAKRKASTSVGENEEKKKTKSKKSNNDYTGKNAVQVLHEMFGKILYTFESIGTVKETSFRVVAEVEETAFEGVGLSKAAAKHNLATKALARLRNIVLPAEEPKQAIQHQAVIGDFKQVVMPGQVQPLYVAPKFMNGKQAPTPMMPPEAVQHGFSQLSANRPTIDEEKARCQPIMILTEVFKDTQLDWLEGTGHGDRQFKVEAEVLGRRFMGEGRSKKMAKHNLSKTILMCMYDIQNFKEIETVAKPNKPQTEQQSLEKKFPMAQLKELIDEDDLTVEVVQLEQRSEEEEKSYHATIVVKGVAYEAIGKNQMVAKLRAAKKALEVLRPKKDIPMSEFLNAHGVDLSMHPLMVFNNLFHGVKITGSESKSVGGPTEYHMEAEVEGNTFKVTAFSKKKAKLRLVLKVFEKLKKTAPSDWMSIDVNDLEDKPISANPTLNNPIALLYRLTPQASFDVTEEESSELPHKFKAVVKIGESDYAGEGPNKKSAKYAAARIALLNKYAINPDEYVEEKQMTYIDDGEPKNETCPKLCDKVAKAVAARFGEVFKDASSPKVVAAFLLAKYDSADAEPMFEVVSIGTGTKCVTGVKMDHKGQTLNDCHGEVIACRGFRQFLFDELVLAMKKKPDTVLQKTASGKYELKSNLKVFLFINTAPCGDGRVFTLQTVQQGARNKTAGLLRTKIENGQGTIPVPENSVQTSDGILEGERLRTMSCSDKILKWNVLGVQGALLSYFINPIYIHSAVIGLHYHYDALYRALYKRACKVDTLPDSFCLNKPFFGTPGSFQLSRDTHKATSNSFNWYYRTDNIEAVDATTGQTITLAPSRLCKLQFFDKFNEVLKLGKRMKPPKTYHAGKSMATDYQKTKEIFYNAIAETTGSKWIGKPYEHDMFGY